MRICACNGALIFSSGNTRAVQFQHSICVCSFDRFQLQRSACASRQHSFGDSSNSAVRLCSTATAFSNTCASALALDSVSALHWQQSVSSNTCRLTTSTSAASAFQPQHQRSCSFAAAATHGAVCWQRQSDISYARTSICFSQCAIREIFYPGSHRHWPAEFFRLR
jgi:hypothetical protein